MRPKKLRSEDTLTLPCLFPRLTAEHSKAWADGRTTGQKVTQDPESSMYRKTIHQHDNLQHEWVKILKFIYCGQTIKLWTFILKAASIILIQKTCKEFYAEE